MNTQIDRKRVIALLQQQNIQSYGFTILFFLIFTFFVFFAIRPNVITAFNLQKELQELRLQDKQYEKQIVKIINYQSLLEGYRDDLPLLDEALPKSPLLGSVIASVEKSATDSGILLSSVEVQKVQYQDRSKAKALKSFHIVASAQSDLGSLNQFLDDVLNKRRLHMIKSIGISRLQYISDLSSDINKYTVDINIECNYL